MEKSEKQKWLAHSLLESTVTETLLLDKKYVTKESAIGLEVFSQILQNSQEGTCAGVPF